MGRLRRITRVGIADIKPSYRMCSMPQVAAAEAATAPRTAGTRRRRDLKKARSFLAW